MFGVSRHQYHLLCHPDHAERHPDCRWIWNYRPLQCLSCRRGRGRGSGSHSEDLAAEQELQDEKDHIHSWWTPLQRGNKTTAMATWKLVIAQLLNIRDCKMNANRAVGPLFSQMIDTWVVKVLFIALAFQLHQEMASKGWTWDVDEEKVLLLYYSLLTSASHVLDKGPEVFCWGTHWSLAVLHTCGGFLCQVWFCTFTL